MLSGRTVSPFFGKALLPLLLTPAGHALSAAPLFQDASPGLSSPQPCAETAEGCYSNYVLLADLNADGHLDLAFANGGGYYEPDLPAPMAVYLNRGDAQLQEVNGSSFGGFQGRLRQVAAGDVDDDGRLELYCPDAWGLQPDAFFFLEGPDTFVDEGPLRLPLSSHAGAARFGDMDGDGDLDLVLTDWGENPPRSPGTAHVYLNDGTGMFTELPDAVPRDTASIGTGPIDLELLDIDGDFDLDLLLASREGDSLLFRNEGAGLLSYADGQLPSQPGPYVYGPDACDIDLDGDLDLWLDNGAPGLREQLLVNDGTGRYTDETSSRLPSDQNLKEDDNEVQCVDLDDDGDFDAVVASLSGNERALINDGRGYFTLQADAFPTRQDSTLGLDLGDLDLDGRLDAVTAQGESGSFLNRVYLGGKDMPVDRHAPVFRRVERYLEGHLAGEIPLRFAVQDRATSDLGPRLLEAHVVLGDGTVLPAHFVGGDLFYASSTGVAGETLRWRPCATDLYGQQACGEEQGVVVLEPSTPTFTPAPVTPAPATPEPATPQSATPQSATPQSATPQSGTPLSLSPEPSSPAASPEGGTPGASPTPQEDSGQPASGCGCQTSGPGGHLSGRGLEGWVMLWALLAVWGSGSRGSRGRKLLKLWGISPDVIPGRSRVDKEVHLELDARIPIDAAQCDTMDGTLVQAAEGGPTDFAEAQSPPGRGLIPGQALLSADPGE